MVADLDYVAIFLFFLSESSCVIPLCFLMVFGFLVIFIDFVYPLIMALINRMCDGWVACKLWSQTEYPASAYTDTVFYRKYSFYISFHWEMFVVFGSAESRTENGRIEREI